MPILSWFYLWCVRCSAKSVFWVLNNRILIARAKWWVGIVYCCGSIISGCAAVDDYMIMNVTAGHYSTDQIRHDPKNIYTHYYIENYIEEENARQERKSILKDAIKFII